MIPYESSDMSSAESSYERSRGVLVREVQPEVVSAKRRLEVVSTRAFWLFRHGASYAEKVAVFDDRQRRRSRLYDTESRAPGREALVLFGARILAPYDEGTKMR